MPDLVEGDADEARAELVRRFREGEQRPGHQLGRLELVMEERVERRARDPLGVGEPARLRGLRATRTKLGRPSRSREAACDGPRFPARRHGAAARA